MDRPVLVIGSGVAGISACLHIAEKCPMRQLSLISHHSPMEPSDDQSKIVRVDYENGERMIEALAAQDCWKKGSFAPYYIPCGRIVAYDVGSQTLQGIDQNRRYLGLEMRERGNKDLLEKFFSCADAPDTLTFVHNPDDAVVNWKPCMLEHESKVKDTCRQMGGSVYETKVDFLQHDGRRVTAVIPTSGDPIVAENVDMVLAVGPWTVEVLERSGIELPPKHRIPIPTGLFAFQLKLDDEQVEYFKDKPIFSHSGRAEFLPPTQDDGNAKITWVEPFTISPIRDVSSSDLALQALENALEWARKMLPRLIGAKVTTIRFYCDGVTATQAPLIARHPVIENLFLDCGGSYTRAKDLPTNGAHIARILNGENGPERFSWNGSTSTRQDHPHLVGRGDFDRLDEQARKVLGDVRIRMNSQVVAIV